MQLPSRIIDLSIPLSNDVVTDYDFISIAAQLLEEYLRR